MNLRTLFSLAVFGLAGALRPCSALAEDLFAYRMPWDDASVNLTNLREWNVRPAGKAGFVHVQEGHLYAGDQRLRLLGVNIVFGSVAPEHDVADRLAARLARFGVNIVRLHHMDSAPAPRGLLQKDMRTLDPAMLERFDYFVAALKREGIYSDINLHVGRKYPGFSGWGETTPNYWKGVDNFYAPMVEMQKEYARDLLLHRNPYTGNRYVDEPAVALIEINNENGLMREWRAGSLNQMGEPYRSDLQRQWEGWLHGHYADDQALRRAWGVREEAPGAEMLGSALNVRSVEAGWNLQLVGSAAATLTRTPDGALDLAMSHAGAEIWHTQLHQNRLAFKTNQPYTLHLRMRADAPLRVGLQAMQAHAPWQALWAQEIQVGRDWQDYQLSFATEVSEDIARITIGHIGLQTGHLYIQQASLRTGGLLGLLPGQSLQAGNVAMPDGSALMSLTVAEQRDWLQFLWDTETAYWQGMRDYLHQDLGAHPLILGTQVSYSPAPIQAALDVVDGHAYWQHPNFPGKPWDLDNWHITNTPMAGVDGGGTLADLALRRVPGKPFIVTEYNHPFPGQYQAEALPLAAAYAALQDWDGLFVYSYGAHSQNWDPGFVENFFDSGANPVKMSSLIAAAAMLRRGDVQAAAVPQVVPQVALPTQKMWLDAWRAATRVPGAESFGAPRTAALSGYASIATPAIAAFPGTPGPSQPVASATGELVWGLPGVSSGRAVSIDSPRSKGLIGARLALPFDAHGVKFELLVARNDWGVILATLIEGKSFAGPCRILVTTLGDEENSGQSWLDTKKTTLGRNFGQAPVLVEGLAARITLPVEASRVRAWALDERGERRAQLPVGGADHAIIETGSAYHSLWYEVEVQ
jgi:hypothetical protein